MIAKLLVLWCALAAAAAAPVFAFAPAAPAHAPARAPYASARTPALSTYAYPVAGPSEDPNPALSFAYGVAGPATGDLKDEAETLQTSVAHGPYRLVEPTVHARRAYQGNGFNGAYADQVAVLTLPGIAHP